KKNKNQCLIRISHPCDSIKIFAACADFATLRGRFRSSVAVPPIWGRPEHLHCWATNTSHNTGDSKRQAFSARRPTEPRFSNSTGSTQIDDSRSCKNAFSSSATTSFDSNRQVNSKFKCRLRLSKLAEPTDAQSSSAISTLA